MAFGHFHVQTRPPGHADRPFVGDVPQETGVHAYGHIGIALEFGRYQRPVHGAVEVAFGAFERLEGALCLLQLLLVSLFLCAVGQGRNHAFELCDSRLGLGDARVDRAGDKSAAHRGGEQRPRQVEIAPRNRQTRTDRKTVADFVRNGGLEGEGREVDLLHEVRSRPVVAPVHRGTVGGVETQSDGQPLGGFVVEIDVDRGRELIVGFLGRAALVTVFQRRQRTIADIGENARHAG